MRYLVGFVIVLALGIVGCGEDPCEGVRCSDGNECTEDRCVGGMCDFPPVEDGTACGGGNECTSGDICADGVCAGTPVDDGKACNDADGNECTGMCADGICAAMPVEDGTACGGGVGGCQGGICDAVKGTFACTEQGIRQAVAAGGGPFTFECDGAQTVTTEAEIVINKDVILDGQGNLIVHGGAPSYEHRVFRLANSAVTATLSGVAITGGYIGCGNGGGIALSGTLTLHRSTITGNAAANCSGLVRGHGGGIYNTGTLTLNDSMMSGNLAISYCTPDCTWFCCTGGRGNDIASEGGTVTLIDSTAEVASWSGGTVTRIDSTLSDIHE
jgi:hypothetical protein